MFKVENGMSLLDYFAGQALVGLLAGHYSARKNRNLSEVPVEAYSIAEAMVAERKERGKAE